jgi:Protein of unknown function (DUF2568)
MLKTSNLALKFLLELAAFAALAYWGTTVGEGDTPILVAIAAPALATALWARYAAPRSAHRLPRSARVPFELAVFALAAGALLAAGSAWAAAVFAALAGANAALLAAWDQWEH